MDPEAAQLEKQHVHDVYRSTAPYFSDLQSKAWPRVRQFLQDQKPGSLIADIGNLGWCHVVSNIFHRPCPLQYIVSVACLSIDYSLYCRKFYLQVTKQKVSSNLNLDSGDLQGPWWFYASVKQLELWDYGKVLMSSYECHGSLFIL